jgi:hypothetical protein
MVKPIPTNPEPADLVNHVFLVTPNGVTMAPAQWGLFVSANDENEDIVFTLVIFTQPSIEQLKKNVVLPPFTMESKTWECFSSLYTFVPVNEENEPLIRKWLQHCWRDVEQTVWNALHLGANPGGNVIVFPPQRSPSA